MSRLLLAGLASVLAVLSADLTADAQTPTPTPSVDSGATLRIVVKPVAPFVAQDGANWVGFSVDLWQAIAQRRGWTYSFIGVDTVDQQLETVRTGGADAALAAISVTSDREQTLDFSYPYFTSGLQVMVPTDQPTFLATLTSFVTPELLKLLGVVALIVLVVAHGIWIAERRSNPDFPRQYLPGLGEALWWAGVTLTTVGYGDRTPKGRLGRTLALIWMFGGIFLLANTTAAVATRATVQQLQHNITGVDDLPGKKVATVQGSTADQFLHSRGVPDVTVDRIEDAYPLLERGEVQAILYDAPVLQHYASTNGDGRIEVVGRRVEPQQYAIALPTNSPYRRVIDQTLLQLMDDGTYDDLYQRWFGTSP